MECDLSLLMRGVQLQERCSQLPTRSSSGYVANENSANSYSMLLASFSRLIQQNISPIYNQHYVLYMLVFFQFGRIGNL